MTHITKKLFSLPGFLAVFILIMCWLVATSGSKSTKIPNGYLMASHDTGYVDLLGPLGGGINSDLRKVVVDYDVSKYAVQGDFVFGYAKAITDGWNSDINSKGGWFVCNTKTGEVWQHLSMTGMRVRAWKNGVFWVPWMRSTEFTPKLRS